MDNNEDTQIFELSASKNYEPNKEIIINYIPRYNNKEKEIEIEIYNPVNIQMPYNSYKKQEENFQESDRKQKLKEQQLLKQKFKINSYVDENNGNITNLNIKRKNNFNPSQNQSNENLFQEQYKKESDKLQNRANILYGNDIEYSSNKNEKIPVTYINNETNIKNQQPRISDVEKTLFPDGLMGDMPLKKDEEIFKNTEIDSQQYNILFEYVIDNIDIPSVREIANFLVGKEAAENLYMSKKDSYLCTEYAKQHLIFENYLKVNSELHEYLKNKIIKQIGEKNLLKIKGIYINANSHSSKKLTYSPDIIKKIKEYKRQLKQSKHIDTSLKFKNFNFWASIGHADIKDMHINKNGEIDMLIIDIYDFNEGENNKLVKIGRNRQEIGEIIPYFIIYHVIINKTLSKKYLKNNNEKI